MELKEFIENFADQFEDTDASEITVSTEFHDLEEWDSLLVMSVIALAKTQYNKMITATEIRNCTTVEDLFNLINNK